MKVGKRQQQGRAMSKKLVCPECGAYYLKNLYIYKKGMIHCGFFCEGCNFAEFQNFMKTTAAEKAKYESDYER